jgi:NitT/TauT family transport system permease protein
MPLMETPKPFTAIRRLHFRPPIPRLQRFSAGDAFILLILVAMLYGATQLAVRSPAVVAGPQISLSFGSLPWYALLSTGRMAVAYVLSLLFSLVYGYVAVRNRAAGRIMMPILDVLQSIPILSFLPVVLLSLTALLPEHLGAELAAILLIFTSQAWNMTFSFYQSMTTLPTELREAASIFRFDPWQRFKTLELPFAALGLIWNSMMSWAGGWFFLMAAEIFQVGTRDFRLQGLGAYLQLASDQGNVGAVLAGLLTLILVIIALDQLVWRPLLVWADKFKLEMVSGDEPPESWFFDLLSRSELLKALETRVTTPLSDALDSALHRQFGAQPEPTEPSPVGDRPSAASWALGAVLGLAVVYGGYRALALLATLSPGDWGHLALSVLATFLRVAISLIIAMLWTVPVGVMIGTNRRAATLLQPVVQVVASVPATALFPVLLLVLLRLPSGLNLAAVLLMLMGTQWYVLFNVIAGAAAIPQDLLFTTDLLRLSRWERWKTLILPALFPYLVTGGITASGGAWNASIVAEYVKFAGSAHATLGVGALIAEATSSGNYAMLLAGTLALMGTVVLVNRSFWRTLYRLAETRFRME